MDTKEWDRINFENEKDKTFKELYKIWELTPSYLVEWLKQNSNDIMIYMIERVE